MLLLFCHGSFWTAFVLLGTRLLWVPPPFCVFLCFTVPASLGQHLVLLGSRLLWVPPQPLFASAFLSWLLWDSLFFVREPASLNPSPLLCFIVLYCPGFSGTAFSSFRVPASLGRSPTLVCFCFFVVAPLGQPLLC